MLLTFAIILLPFLCRGEPATQIINPTSNEMFLLNKIEKLEDEVVDLKNKLTMILEMVRSAMYLFFINGKNAFVLLILREKLPRLMTKMTKSKTDWNI